jgi:hypothetical protein
MEALLVDESDLELSGWMVAVVGSGFEGRSTLS